MQQDFEGHDRHAEEVRIPELARKVREILGGKNAIISCISVFGNPIVCEGDCADSLASLERLIDNAHLFGTDLVTGFTGRIPDRPLEESIPRFKEVFGELAKRAANKGVRLAFENCNMSGNWNVGEMNIAHNPGH